MKKKNKNWYLTEFYFWEVFLSIHKFSVKYLPLTSGYFLLLVSNAKSPKTFYFSQTSWRGRFEKEILRSYLTSKWTSFESFIFLIRIDLQLLISYENDVLGIEDVVYMYCSSLISTYGNYKTVLWMLLSFSYTCRGSKAQRPLTWIKL